METLRGSYNEFKDLSKLCQLTKQEISDTMEESKEMGRKRLLLLKSIFKRIDYESNVKDGKSPNSDFTIKDLKHKLNHDFGSLKKFKLRNSKLGKTYMEKLNIKNLQELKPFLFPFPLSDDQFCEFLLLSRPLNNEYYLDNMVIDFGQKYKFIKRELENMNMRISRRQEQLEQNWHPSYDYNIHDVYFDHRQISGGKDYQYDLQERQKEEFINKDEELKELQTRKKRLEMALYTEEIKFYNKYPYLKSKKTITKIIFT